jgi:hypothetical protein
MADGTLSSIHYAERFRWFVSEYLEIRRSKGSLLDHAYLTDDLVQLIHDAFKSRLLPCELQNRAESSGVGSAGMLGVRLIGYQSFVDVTQPDEKFVDDPTRVLELRPGWMGELWPQFFPSLMYVSSRPDEPYGEMIVKAKKDRFFVYVGAFAKLCELIAENIEREMAADNQADEDDADDGVLLDGLYRADALFVWNGKRYEWLTETMMDVLELLCKCYPEPVKPSAIEHKIGSIPEGGFKKVFRVNRKDQKGLHEVVSIISGRASKGWYLIK